MITVESIWTDVTAIREQAPLVHNITNYVVMNTTANALLALGASPVMAHANAEVEEMTAIAGALVVNIGTLSPDWVSAMETAIVTAGKKGKPVILDPVGVGATSYRTRTARMLLDLNGASIVRGNASEIMALHSAEASTKGVDSTAGAEDALSAARALSAAHDLVTVISGETDFVIGDSREIAISNGHPMMPRVTGLGCTASALLGAFAAVNADRFAAAAHGMAVMGICGEIAAGRSEGPGSLQLHFIDALYNLSADDIAMRLKVS
ncbi:MAG: hydroxyethylthiazole kinase [Verrucomicrobia bacterium]|nr:hydroxyethylthiazole kinase [Verrucomicrobiota bacterium]